ncbi:hypothetical protein RB620_25950 [Paenibacillus sp. LHD-117]|uniref:hypothetical protein n=1 Tax=Paenibacillus sp. LHD-117 TaxID=3071412 RepID=UPI0027DEE7EA|nr:hypothetical protein [Paenibacillus sp. LHD-117]MDQ6422875.1 hypothetical protein [Paenibacillus sp. LHD-117]
MDNVIPFVPRPNPLEQLSAEEISEYWEKGFALYCMSVGLLTIAERSDAVNIGQDVYASMYRGIQIMAEVNRERMERIVMDPELIERALRGK